MATRDKSCYVQRDLFFLSLFYFCLYRVPIPPGVAAAAAL